ADLVDGHGPGVDRQRGGRLRGSARRGAREHRDHRQRGDPSPRGEGPRPTPAGPGAAAGAAVPALSLPDPVPAVRGGEPGAGCAAYRRPGVPGRLLRGPSARPHPARGPARCRPRHLPVQLPADPLRPHQQGPPPEGRTGRRSSRARQRRPGVREPRRGPVPQGPHRPDRRGEARQPGPPGRAREPPPLPREEGQEPRVHQLRRPRHQPARCRLRVPHELHRLLRRPGPRGGRQGRRPEGRLLGGAGGRHRRVHDPAPRDGLGRYRPQGAPHLPSRRVHVPTIGPCPPAVCELLLPAGHQLLDPVVTDETDLPYGAVVFDDEYFDHEPIRRRRTTAAEILNMSICEPALGSGAFAIEAVRQLATEYLTRRQDELDQRIDPEQYAEELQRVKAFIALHNVYGVDLNSTAVELAEVSLWLDTMAPGLKAPWFGLRLRAGNSLIGARHAVYSADTLAQARLKAVAETAPEDLPVTTVHDPVDADGIRACVDGKIFHFLVPGEGWLAAAS